MNTATLAIDWNQATGTNAVPLIFNQNLSVFAMIGVKRRETRCPSCHSIIYSRRHKLCGTCGEMLPPQCRFDESETERVQALIQTERARHRVWLQRTT